ncbi:MAG: SpoIID/LytB domain-containing protein [Pyrinomonadaceae bacterium]|nr:SpoIID/LytB domain-containing protein [Pyrinomonadaceae bacterium]
MDRDLSNAAATALGDREGTVIVMDARTGRVRAVANPQLAFETAFAPGSTIKPFTALTALRAGTIEADSRLLCREHFSHEHFESVCSHPRGLPPLKPAEALAYSCNYFFGKLGERLRESDFNSTLAEFGFGQPTKVTRAGVREVSGKLPHGQWNAETALGEGAEIEVTPIQLLAAYSALVNGGHLLVPQIVSESGFEVRHQREISIDNEHRQVVLDGMRGAVRYGTAERARLYSLPLYVFGKTGTATPFDGFRTHGWFVGFASGVDESPGAPENSLLAVLVFVKRAHGADAADIARPIFETYLRGGGGRGDGETRRRGDGETRRRGDGETRRRGDGETRGQGDTDPLSGLMSASPYLPISPSPRPPVSVSPGSPRIRVSVSSSVRTMSLEDYVRGVVAAEGSTEMEVEALKALAVASRTYAVKNLRRHEVDGYDFCTTTHCQRYLSIDTLTSSQISTAGSSAVRETAGQVLRDKDSNVVDSYFSASCGGATANIGTLWGVKTPSYLSGGTDEYCLTMPHHTWRDVISSGDLLKALESDPRTMTGGSLRNVSVSRRDASGRAELITIYGARYRTVSGWDLKIIVGRALGWNLLKSSRFEISRSGANYVFRGSGFGHGLGLCQEGAHVMARRGAHYQQILAKYFPGTRLRRGEGETGRRGDGGTGRRGDGGTERLGYDHTVMSHHAVSPSPHLPVSPFPQPHISVSPSPPFPASPGSPISTARRTLSSEHFRVSYPARLSQPKVEYVLKVLETNRADLYRRVSTGGVSFQLPVLELFINESTGDFVSRTGQPSWVAAATLRNRVELQPLELLTRRRILETTIRHELVHSVIEAIGAGRAPRWLAEGLALHIAGEGPKVARYLRQTEIAVADLELRLSRRASAADMRADYAAAYREVKRLIDTEGESAVWRRVIALRKD